MSKEQKAKVVGYSASTPGKSGSLFSFRLNIDGGVLDGHNIAAHSADDLPADLHANLQALVRRLFDEELIFFFCTNLRQPVPTADFYTDSKSERDVMELAEKLCAFARELVGGTELPERVENVRDAHRAIMDAFKAIL